MAVLDLLARLIMKLPYERKLLYAFWAILFLTYVASIATVFLGCRPISLHWQINPDPGDWYANSRRGYVDHKLTPTQRHWQYLDLHV